MDKVKVKENVINDIKLNIPIEIKSGEKMMSVVFIYADKDICYSVICKNTDHFSKIEKIFYDKYPEYKNTKNYYVVNGRVIDVKKTLDDNKIKDSDNIIFKTFK